MADRKTNQPKHTWETLVGQPSKMTAKSHNTAGSAKTRLVNAFEEMQRFGASFNHALGAECVSRIEEVKNINLAALVIDDWRSWQVSDEPTGTTLVVQVRRTT